MQLRKAWEAVGRVTNMKKREKLQELAVYEDWEVRDVMVPRGSRGGDNQGVIVTPFALTDSVPWMIVHGTGNDHLFPQLHLIQYLARRGRQVICLDVDGHGGGSSTTLGDHSVNCCTEQVAWILDHLNKPAVHLLGQSLGGALAIQAAAELPDTVRSLCVVSTPVRLGIGTLRIVEELAAVARPSLYRQIDFYGHWGVLPALGRFKRWEFPVRTQPQGDGERGYVATVARLFERLDIGSVAARVSCPCLLVYGALDPIAPLSAGSLLERSMQQADLVVVARETHYTTFFSNKFVEEVDRWLIRAQNVDTHTG